VAAVVVVVKPFDIHDYAPFRLRRCPTWDRWKEMSACALLTKEIGLPVYFPDARSRWQRGRSEHLNGLLLPYFPEGTHISRWSTPEIQAIAATIIKRPRPILGWRTPAEALADHLRSIRETTVATTG
jgi:IS30 family transposase